MNYQTRLAKRGGTYYFRAKIPADLIAHYGKKEIKVSLKTTDKREAVRLCNLTLLVSVPSQPSVSSILQKRRSPFFPAYLRVRTAVFRAAQKCLVKPGRFSCNDDF